MSEHYSDDIWEGEGPLEAKVHALLAEGDKEGAAKLLEENYEDFSWVGLGEEDA